MLMAASPGPLADARPQAMTVDIIAADEVAKSVQPGPLEAKEKQEIAAATSPVAPVVPPAEASLPAATTPLTRLAEEEHASAPRQAAPEPALPAQAVSPPTQERPVEEPREPPVQEPTTPQRQASIFDGGGAEPVPDLLPSSPGLSGAASNPWFDARADSKAELEPKDVALFRAHLRRCWKPPAAAAGDQTMRLVVRVFLKPNGSLAGTPMLLEASVSPQGPALVQAAMRALRQCQPYSFLPVAKYNDWKVLDLGMSPREMAGG